MAFLTTHEEPGALRRSYLVCQVARLCAKFNVGAVNRFVKGHWECTKRDETDRPTCIDILTVVISFLNPFFFKMYVLLATLCSA